MTKKKTDERKTANTQAEFGNELSGDMNWTKIYEILSSKNKKEKIEAEAETENS
ncbi:hypothetical protein [Bacillus massiliglaciei]|uniref:hypothetical protein n=1 Tax=Bacillus massiliglaciei TaxID=1816693 RepID=UPI0018FEB3AA|nr:hypothetical protein [Bacillus massiliglaciei]